MARRGGEEEAAEEEIEEGARLMEMDARWMKITQLWARGGWRWVCRSGCAWWVCAGEVRGELLLYCSEI